MNVTSNHTNLVVVQSIKVDDSHIIIQELGKFNLKINAIPNGLQSYISFNMNNNLTFIDSFWFLDSLVKILAKDDFEYLTQEFHND